MKYRNFTHYLEYQHMKENPGILDDDLVEAFEDWLDGMTNWKLIEYADKYKQEHD
jgi:hypothetical protein